MRLNFVALLSLFLVPITDSVKPQQLLYTLHAEGLSLPSYVVGPKRSVNALNVNSLVITKQLERAREEHHRLVELVESNTALSSTELSLLKKQKLMAKDTVVKLLKRLSVIQNKPSLTPLLIELGTGGFGKVLFGHCLQTKQEVAIKVASVQDSSSLWKESLLLNRLRNCKGFTKVLFFGQQNVLDSGQHVVMVMNVLGPALDKLLHYTTLGTS